MNYNSNNYMVKFIKSILKSTHIPKIPFLNIKEGKEKPYVIKGKQYICKNKIVRALKNGEPECNLDINYFEIIGDYIFNEPYLNLTETYQSNTDTYDSTTHYYLGRYLNLIKEVKGVNLFPFYNKYDGTITNDFSIKRGSLYDLELNPNEGDTYWINIPIELDKEYTIYIDCEGELLLSSLVYNTIGPITGKLYNTIIKNDNTFNKPFTYKVNSNQVGNDILFDKYLNMVIQLPISRGTPKILILEGNYLGDNIVYNKEGFGQVTKVFYGELEGGREFTDKEVDYYCKCIPSLFLNVGKIPLAFSNKLIEYLTGNVITKDDSIIENINRIQDKVSRSMEINYKEINKYRGPIEKGTYNNNLRMFLYDLYKDSFINGSIDNKGWVDKELEYILEEKIK